MFIGLKNIVDGINNLQSWLPKKVLQIHPQTLQVVKIWNSVAEAAEAIDISIHTITPACRGEYFHCKGYYWKYLNEFINPQYIRCDNNLNCNIFNLLPGGYLNNYNIEPCFISLPGEFWKDVVGYEGLYQVSNFGRVITLYEKPYIKILSDSINSGGYCQITLHKNNNKITNRIHRLVAEAFIPNPNNLPHVNHKDEIKTNNFVNNLEWCTHEYNMNYGTRLDRFAKAVSKTVQQIDLTTGKVINEYWGAAEAERITGVKACNISLVCSGDRKSSGGYSWRYKE